MNIPLTVPFLYGLVWLIRAPRIGARYGVVLAAVGVAAFLIHSWFFLQGRQEFRVPASIGVLIGRLVASIGLAWQSVRILRRPVEE